MRLRYSVDINLKMSRLFTKRDIHYSNLILIFVLFKLFNPCFEFVLKLCFIGKIQGIFCCIDIGIFWQCEFDECIFFLFT